jgi:hypothetical protein
MKRARYAAFGVVIVGMCLLLGVKTAAAVTVAPEPIVTPETLPTSPILITAYHINGSSLQFVQLYNNSSELISLDGGRLVYGYAYDLTGTTRTAVETSGLLEPRKHVIIAVQNLLVGAALPYHFTPTTVATTTLATLQFLMPSMAPSTVPVALKTNGTIQQRGKTSTGYSTVTFGDFAGDLYADGLYTPPSSPPLKVIEVAPRAKTCAPFSLDPICGDYVKLKIQPGYSDDMLSDYRMRSDDGSESVTNTFSLANASRHGDYVLMRLRDDGQLMTLTNSGGYVWLEDRYGVTRYDQTLTSYANAGSERYIDQSWALDESDSIWKWAIPSPTGSNTFPHVLAAQTGVEELTTCPTGKYRNPETNRCRSIEEAVSALTACEEGKERNPATNRCRSIATLATATLSPCAEGEERNPSTNRCRKVVSTGSTLTPCQQGYERNPETNRCKKASSIAAALSSPAAVAIESSGGSALKNALIITAGLGALGYGFYEWRSELWRALRRLSTFVTGK